ncbi:MAG: rod shape-determining protein MreD [Pseudomonadota bacterium]|jgi:rod shape-determining protein MreD
MNRPQYILLPVNPFFIAFSLLLAFLLNLLPWGSSMVWPDMVALTLVFWSIHHPRKVGVGVAFFMGLLMDVHNASLLGENALAYTLLSYFAITIHRRVLWFPLTIQVFHVLPLLIFAQLVELVVRLVIHGKFPGWMYFAESVIGALLWPLITGLLLAPQRRAVNHDETRPI